MTGFRADAGTLRFAVLGYPVRHSLSPRMHEAAFRTLAMSATYEAIEVPPEELGRELARLHAEGYVGLNLTTPHKERAVTLVSGTTAEAREAGAVNTLRREPGGWMGHATDGLGFEAWARDSNVQVRGARVLLVGAGGAARSIAPSLARLMPASVQIVSRTGAHAHDVAARLEALSGRMPVRASALEDEPPANPWDLLIRLLSAADVGPAEARWWRGLADGAAVLEGNYEGRAAGARALAQARGLRFEDGLGLLLQQGVRSFEFWLSVEAPVEAMRQALVSR
ncbi:MAG TPA: shikimate dehydrogenase [Candidatus Eisenbacteria bacterium]|nr:shikimate dehydrogenase [Candidatus Eisenbacteria bacterium]